MKRRKRSERRRKEKNERNVGLRKRKGIKVKEWNVEEEEKRLETKTKGWRMGWREREEDNSSMKGRETWS